MKKILLCSLLLVSCAVLYPQYTGQSLTDATLKADVERVVTQYFRAINNNCQPEKINTQIINYNLDQSNGVINQASELWTVTGCGVTKRFPITMRTDSRGETDFNVTMDKD